MINVTNDWHYSETPLKPGELESDKVFAYFKSGRFGVVYYSNRSSDNKWWDDYGPISEEVECWCHIIDEEDAPLTINGYQKEAMRTASGMSNEYPRVLNGLMGLNGEAGEAIDILKKHLFQGHDLDKEHLAKELGDVSWYLAVSAEAIGYNLETIFQMNVDKLRKRYPDGFESKRSINRESNDI